MITKLKSQGYRMVTLNKKGDEVYGALYLNEKRITDIGWWRTSDANEALIRAFNSVM